MPTVLETLQKGTEFLEKYGVEDGRTHMQHLIAHVMKCDRMQLYVDFDRPVEDAQLVQLREFTKKRASGVPLQHLLGSVEFCGREFKTDARALIPRPETEELAWELLGRLDEAEVESPRILDVGCGSGVLGISLSLEIEGADVTLSDVCSQALSLAQENATALEADVTFVEGDLFAAVEGAFDLIVANLPYISAVDMGTLSREVQHDPNLALHGGEIGTEIMVRLLNESPNYLKSGGIIALEHGYDQAKALADAATSAGLSSVECMKDVTQIDRFLFAAKP